MRKKVAFVVRKRKFRYGPIANAVRNTGLVDLISMGEQYRFDKYEVVILFNNKFPQIKRKHSTPVVWWMNDLRKPKDLQPGPPYNFDKIFLCQKSDKQDYIDTFGAPVHYMPQCGIEVSCKKGRKIDWDIVFIGSTENNIYHNDRAELLKALASNFRLKCINGEKNTCDQVWIYNQTPFSISVSLPVTGYTSNRLYNILSSGGFAVVRYFPEIEQLFENHKHLVWFHDTHEAVEIMKYYSKNEEQCRRIREKGRELYYRKHSARERILNMYDIVMGREHEFRGYL